ncbi:DNA recombination protein RecO [Candidatus Liberibacter solanacearum]|uniref:DNA repair protein RecO n=1 Tax=Candidatus Liberibacter solanacearum TaxID=556287 RepID=A0A095A157_9HYPH|nr:DNA repair protein RecO [Candidatus Liberibacter solanacearum]KGB27776.1 DNA recombination protein RecO [Candidatus Liberibacter solanacearum]KJZ81406.1 DNA recombination protein RecO [Candidatus Liberibacter solanacearum]KJZ82482.1 DNA recombination and repair protein RecO [Candidatus Liberibacter solanacearum]KQC49039.1 DNA repair protein RecO [Candidatus Liberibacter solanacearum]
MHWQDDAIVLGVRSYGEKNIILEVMTRHYGRHLGFVRYGQSRRMQPVLQVGNLVRVNWRSRLEQDLGEFRLEIIEYRCAKLLSSAISLYGLQSMIPMFRFLPERDPCPDLYDLLNLFINSHKISSILGKIFIQIELILLKNIGFGLEITKCVVTGVSHDLSWVSPKSGGAICHSVGLPYASKMLVLPLFLWKEQQNIDADSLRNAFRLTGYFLDKYAFQHNIIYCNILRINFLNKLIELL